MLFFHILSSLAFAVVVIGVWISALQVPSFDRAALKYLKLDTSSSGSPSMVTQTLVLHVLFTITLDFFLLSSIPYALALSTSLLVRFSLLLPAIRSILSVKYRLQTGLPATEIEVMVVEGFLHNSLQKQVGENRHPCLIVVELFRSGGLYLY